MKKSEILATEDKDLTAAQLKKKNNWLGLPTEEVVEETTEVEETTDEVVEETTDEEIKEKIVQNEKSAEVDYIKDIRFDVDKISKLASSIQLETKYVERSLFLGKAWLGKVLGQLGNDNPATEETATNIEKEVYSFKTLNAVDQVISLRKRCKAVIVQVQSDEFAEVVEKDRLACEFATLSYQHLNEASFFLGEQLSKLKK